MDWRKQVGIVDSFPSYHARSLTAFSPTMDNVRMGENDHFLREVCTGMFRPQAFQQLGLLASALCPRGASMSGCWANLPATPPPREQGKQGSAPASLCWGSLHGRCRGQVPSEPAGHLPMQAQQVRPNCLVSDLWLHGPWCSFWHKQPLNPVLGTLLPIFSWRSKRQTLPQLLLENLFQLRESRGRECLHCSTFLTHFCHPQERSTKPPAQPGKE